MLLLRGRGVAGCSRGQGRLCPPLVFSTTPYSHDHYHRESILCKALTLVPVSGWTAESLLHACDELGLSRAAAGMFPRGAVELVEFFQQDCNRKLSERLSLLGFKDVPLRERLKQAIQMRLEMIVPYKETWAKAIALQALPPNAPHCLWHGATLMDEIWHHAGDKSSDVSWYFKRAGLGAIYAATEIFLLQDTSEHHAETWEFLDRRLEDASYGTQLLSHAANLLATVFPPLGYTGERKAHPPPPVDTPAHHPPTTTTGETDMT